MKVIDLSNRFNAQQEKVVWYSGILVRKILLFLPLLKGE